MSREIASARKETQNSNVDQNLIYLKTQKSVCPSGIMVQISSASNWPQIKVLDFINFGPIYTASSRHHEQSEQAEDG